MKILLLFLACLFTVKAHSQAACSVTLGYNGAATILSQSTNVQCNKITATNQLVNTFHGYVDFSSGAPLTAMFGIYDDENGSPVSLIQASGIILKPSTGWQLVKSRMQFKTTLNGTYWIVAQTNDLTHYYQNGLAGYSGGYFPYQFDFFLPSVITGFVAESSTAYDFYLDYCP